ncbi:MAG: hypothetical protein ACI97A_002359 [Planctomycetota bacterium]|jgi:hypothetical protein
MQRFLLLVIVFALLGTVAPAQNPVVVRGPYLQQGTPTSVIVCWRTDLPCDSIVNFGSLPTGLFSTAIDPFLTTEHRVQVNGLSANTKFYYSLEATGVGVLAGGTEGYHFVTAPPTGEAKNTRIWIVGDSGTADTNARNVRDAYYLDTADQHTDLMLMLGDNAYTHGTDTQYQFAMFQNMYEAMLRKTVVWPTYGNHDALSANATALTGPYFEIFELPSAGEVGGLPSGTEAYYSFDYGDIHFVVLDSQTSDRSVGGAMATWTQADLAANTSKWTIVYFHHPPYSKGSHDSDVESRLIQMRQNFLPILENAGVDMVFGGHSHAYERSYLLSGHYGLSNTYSPANHAVSASDGRVGLGGAYQKQSNANGSYDGCVYVVAGASGKISGGSYNHPTSFMSVPVLGSVILDVKGSQLDARYMDSNGYLTDFFTLTKDGVTPVQTTHLPALPSQNWKYEDSGTDLGTAWSQPGFDDSSWGPPGLAPLGYGEPWISTLLSFGTDPNNKPITSYLRREFVLDLEPGDVKSLIAGVLYDDGCVVYLNGVEVVRSSSLPAGPITFATTASGHEATTYERYDLAAAIPLLQRGINHLAVEIHQRDAISSDLAFDMALLVDGRRSFLPPEASGAVSDAAGEVESVFTINGSDGGFGRSVDVKIGEPFAFDIQTPSVLNGAAAPFTLFGYTGTPTAADVFPLPFNLGPMVFPPAYPGVSAPLSFLVGDNLVGLPGALVFTNPAPWNAMNPGIGFPATFTLQGWIATGGGQTRTFNAIRMRVSP